MDEPTQVEGNKMDNSSLAIGLGIGVILGFALGISTALIITKKTDTSSTAILPAKEESEGIMYNYDDHNRLQSIIPIGKRIG